MSHFARLSGLCLVSILALTPRPAHAVFPATSFNEIAQTADLIFYGTVASIDYKTSGTGVYTEATFEQVEIQNATTRSRQRGLPAIKLRYAGGQLENGNFLRMGDSPGFKTGHRYLVFARDDGQNFLTPVVGGNQGLFEVITDPVTSQPVITTEGGRAVTGINEQGRPALSATPIGPAARSVDPNSDRYRPATATTPDGQTARPAPATRDVQTSAPISIRDFNGLINKALSAPAVPGRLSSDDGSAGKYIRINDQGEREYQDLFAGIPNTTETATAPAAPHDIETRGQALQACGYQTSRIAMEPLPNGWWENGPINNALNDYNNYMDLYRVYSVPDGSYGHNNVNEFGGAASNSSLSGIYGTWNWAGMVGVCFSYFQSAGCSRILETDIFWNPQYSYTDDVSLWFRTSGSTYNLTACMAHEVGHSWGYQQGVPEQYNYDQPSVMHAMYQNVYETGRGLHAMDAWFFREHYKDQLPILSYSDLGIESYYSSNGLISSSFSSNTYFTGPGSQLSFYNVVSENMQRGIATNVRVRFFLSKTFGFEGGSNYKQVGIDWTFDSIDAETWTKNDFVNNTIPNDLAPGTYNILAYIDSNGAADSFGNNNTAVFTEQVSVYAPVVSTSKTSISGSVFPGSTSAGDSFNCSNIGGGKMNYSVAVTYNGAASGWLTPSITSGDSAGESDNVSCTFNGTNMTAGTYTAQVTISCTNVSGITPKVVNVTFIVNALTNNNFSSASVLSGLTGTVTTLNQYATKETGEPNHAGYLGGPSLWWTWTAPATGPVTIDTIGSTFDTLLGVYTGSSVSGLTTVISDDESGGDHTSKVTFLAQYATTYKIAIDGYVLAYGTTKLNYTLAPYPSSVDDWSIY